MSNSNTAYKCISTGVFFLSPDDQPTYDVFVSILTYGNRSGLGNPPLDLEPKISGLLKDDAFFWALGQAQVFLDGGAWRITKRDLEGDKTNYGIWLEDNLGARRGILISEVSERATMEYFKKYPPT